MRLTRLLYFSENVMGGGDRSLLAGLQSILSASNRNNKAVGITGALVFDDFWFLQALEGDRDQVHKTLKRIEGDERHANVIVMDARQVDARIFGNWWMGLATRNEETAPIFEAFLKNGMLRPRDMSGDDVLALMTALCKKGLSRKLAAA